MVKTCETCCCTQVIPTCYATIKLPIAMQPLIDYYLPSQNLFSNASMTGWGESFWKDCSRRHWNKAEAKIHIIDIELLLDVLLLKHITKI